MSTYEVNLTKKLLDAGVLLWEIIRTSEEKVRLAKLVSAIKEIASDEFSGTKEKRVFGRKNYDCSKLKESLKTLHPGITNKFIAERTGVSISTINSQLRTGVMTERVAEKVRLSFPEIELKEIN